jgi:hypothetical protein
MEIWNLEFESLGLRMGELLMKSIDKNLTRGAMF